MQQLTKLELAFQKAICTETVPAGQSHVCGCGQTYQNTDEPLFYGMFQGAVIVAGCNCQFSSAFGGMIWGHRHAIADFFRIMADVLDSRPNPTSIIRRRQCPKGHRFTTSETIQSRRCSKKI